MKVKTRVLFLLVLVLTGLLFLGCTSKKPFIEKANPHERYKEIFESAVFYVDSIWKIRISSIDCPKEINNCKLSFLVEDVLKGEANYFNKTYSLELHPRVPVKSRSGHFEGKYLKVYSPEIGDTAILFVEKIDSAGKVTPFYTYFSSFADDHGDIGGACHSYLMPFSAVESEVRNLLKTQTRSDYQPPLGVACTLGLFEDDEKLVAEIPNVWQIRVYSENTQREIKITKSGNYIPKRYDFKIKIEKILKGEGQSLAGKILEASELEWCSSQTCRREFAGFSEADPPLTIGVSGSNENFLFQGKVHFYASFKFDKKALKNLPYEHLFWIPFDDYILQRFVHFGSKKVFQHSGQFNCRPGVLETK